MKEIEITEVPWQPSESVCFGPGGKNSNTSFTKVVTMPGITVHTDVGIISLKTCPHLSKKTCTPKNLPCDQAGACESNVSLNNIKVGDKLQIIYPIRS